MIYETNYNYKYYGGKGSTENNIIFHSSSLIGQLVKDIKKDFKIHKIIEVSSIDLESGYMQCVTKYYIEFNNEQDKFIEILKFKHYEKS
jgi:hypothetical protein